MKKALTGSVSHTEETIKELRADQQFAAEYLKAALEELDDPDNRAAGLLALRDVAEAYGGLEGINSMKKKRDIFAELAEGFDALKSQREGKHTPPPATPTHARLKTGNKAAPNPTLA